MEIWKDIPGYDGSYQISNRGRVSSIGGRNGKTVANRIMRQKLSNGYPQVVLRKNGRHTHYVHRLVAENFIANPASKREVNHIDGNKTNNDVSNLEWVTSSENQLHAYVSGLQGRGSRHGTAKLTEEQVHEIRARRKAGEGNRQIAETYDVSENLVSKICLRQIWTHI